ncbi:MAG TPA: nicotinate-nucleotide adenylyltransferase [Acidimicrobiales bacterium]|nr:nicotinate-nucleotide adenylyltransferase [Acidimicrobiales bacterium]
MAGDPARIGIFGGTFDPIHSGHIEAADTVYRSLGLDRMLLVVANEPWQKEGTRSVTPAEDRYAMVEAATVGHPGLEPSRIEIERGGPSYTVDTVNELHRRYPSSELIVVVGADVVGDLSTWRDEPTLRQNATLAVVDRPGVRPVDPPAGWRSVRVPVAPFDVSSTELRSRLETGQSVDGLVPDPVIRCIRLRGLYATGR